MQAYLTDGILDGPAVARHLPCEETKPLQLNGRNMRRNSVYIHPRVR